MDSENTANDTTNGLLPGHDDTNTGDSGKTKSDSTMVSMPQSDLNKIMAERAVQAKRSLLKEIGVDDTDTLKAMIAAYKKAEETRIAEEEAKKSELQKKQDEIDTITGNYNALSALHRTKLIENAIMRLAPKKEIPSDRFKDLIKLMDTSIIKVVDGEVKDSDVDMAIDTVLKDSPYLKARLVNGNGLGSPVVKQQKSLPEIKADISQKRRYGI